MAAIIGAGIERFPADVGVTHFSVSTAVVTAQRLLWVNYGDPVLIGGRQLHPSKLPAPRLHRSFGQYQARRSGFRLQNGSIRPKAEIR